eukprot:CAMPEP_0196812210 /NCGR_PEP_ID=MMETSP1362-20130617/22379_1 /TAXON_ID=163516 /ORGANISM="Leptocylindrus danicus, Strain CCMP1856" /LENGTH=403 /DNA_ID=CAMNT_0042187721 /DNA_START=35 /DNA_END=1246 /DNA_ORIENTATION=-
MTNILSRELEEAATEESNEDNVGIALALVCGAGLSTAVGASLVFFPSLVKLASRRVLASSLGISAGVMLYVSFAEIFIKSQDAFVDSGMDDDMSFIYATLCLFGGMIFMVALDILVHKISTLKHSHEDPHTDSIADNNMPIVEVDLKHGDAASPNVADHAPRLQEYRENEVEGTYAPHCVGCSADPGAELDEWQINAEREIQEHANNATAAEEVDSKSSSNTCTGANLDEEQERNNKNIRVFSAMSHANKDDDLMKMGVNTALAIGLHNFPEGLATFVAALSDPSVGAVLALAIGIHNIPEGVCVALPIYYATGNRTKAFLWALLSGVSEPIAALLGWAILATSFTDTTYAILFGMVSGMMIIISLKELIPTAHRYDKEDTVVTYSLIVGMGIMAMSLVLFRI